MTQVRQKKDKRNIFVFAIKGPEMLHNVTECITHWENMKVCEGVRGLRQSPPPVNGILIHCCSGHKPTIAVAAVNMQKTVGVTVMPGVTLQPFGSAITNARPPPDNYHVIFLGVTGSQSQCSRGLRRRSTAARLLRSWVRIPPGHGCLLCVWSGRGLGDELITRPEESYLLWRVVCDYETLWYDEAIARAGLQSQRK
jgi:hypothetical protein